jgi:hypothetical protein
LPSTFKSRTVFFQRARGADLYIISGSRNQHTNVWVGDMLAEEEKLGELNYDVPPINDVSAQDLVAQAYKELMERQELKEEYGRVAAIAQKWGY